PSSSTGASMIFAKRLAGQGHMRLFTIEHDVALGWVAREQDDRATHTSMIRDWRHVEATIALFELKASALRNEGWREIAPGA
ncbi:MAG TPA: hypothetical protein VGC23_08185, partial [Vicinamibacterales bacterium]